jgi:sodium-independent sulfate anion transporter 11
VKDIHVGPPGDGKLITHQKKIKKSLWFISISRNAIIVLISAILAFCFEMVGPSPFILSGMLKPFL